MVVPTLCLLMAIGVMIGTWLQSGTNRHHHRVGSSDDQPGMASAADSDLLFCTQPGGPEPLTVLSAAPVLP